MHRSGNDPARFRAGLVRHILIVAALAAAIAVLQGCSGSAHPAFFTPTPNSPGSGETLEAIQITPTSALIGLAEHRQLSALGIYNDGTTQDVSSEVTWSASSAPSATNFVSVNSSGIATGMAIGATVITATLGPVTGLIDLTVETNGFTSGTTAILSVPYKTTIVDAAYLPQQTMIQGAYAVQEVNLDADQFSNVLPVPVALLSSIPMPAGFVPNAAVASQSNYLVAVISYTSPNVQIIDASNLSTDLTDNTVISTFTAPVTQKVTLNGVTCMICAAVVNPVSNRLLLSTAQGFYTMDLVSGNFTALAFTPAPVTTQAFSLNPIAKNPYILSTDPATSDIQILNLTTSAVTTVNSGLTAPSAVALDLITDYAAIVDADTTNQSLLTLTDLQNPLLSAASGIGVCAPPAPQNMNMVALGVSQNPSASAAAHTLFTSQTSGSCVGFEIWPPPSESGQPLGQLQPSLITYGYGPLSNTPDGNTFVNGGDPNAIATFNSVVDKNNYGLLIDGNPQANQQWIAKINFGNLLSNYSSNLSGMFLPDGFAIPPVGLCATEGNGCIVPLSVVFLPTPSTALTVSLSTINFGTVSVGTSSAPIPVTVSNIAALPLAPVISLQGANAGDFSAGGSCSNLLQPRSNCSIIASFTPSAKGARSAVLNVGYSGANPQTILLSGTAQ